MSDPRIDSYEWAGGREPMLRFGPAAGPVVVLALPLFEEANRTRAFGVGILRALAARGIGGVLPELPGQGESTTDLAETTLLQQREAIEHVVNDLLANGRLSYAIGLRSGALLDTFALFSGRWHFAPQSGESLVRDLLRVAKAAGTMRRDADLYTMMGSPGPAAIAGNLVAGAMIADLQCAEVYDQPGVPRRVLRLQADPAEADLKLAGEPPWRRAEPGNDIRLAQALASDIAEWIAACES